MSSSSIQQRPTASRVNAVTRPADDLGEDLAASCPISAGNVAFLHGGDGLIGWGVHAGIRVTGPDAAARIGEWFAGVIAGIDHLDEVGLPGSGPVAFCSLGFDPRDESVAVVPAVLVGRRDGVTFRTVIGAPQLRTPEPIAGPGQVTYADAGLSVTGFTTAVAAATARIRAGELAKVVLAHDLHATTQYPVDERFLLRRLMSDYPTCWTYVVDGLIGASPEMLIRRRGTAVSSRVLAGTAWPEHAEESVVSQLLGSHKDLDEHEYAVASVARSLEPVTTTLRVPESPSPLVLSNLTHLATDVTGELADPAPTALQLAARLHPTAAVGGTPTDLAMQVIRELEPTRRGRYAGPVGWMDASGDGEFAIALRCAEVSGTSVRLVAGCGIVAESDPETEAREAQVKMIPVRDALEG